MVVICHWALMTGRTMPKVKTNRVKYPEGWELIEPTLRELQAKMREGGFFMHQSIFMFST